MAVRETFVLAQCYNTASFGKAARKAAASYRKLLMTIDEARAAAEKSTTRGREHRAWCQSRVQPTLCYCAHLDRWRAYGAEVDPEDGTAWETSAEADTPADALRAFAAMIDAGKAHFPKP